MNSRITGGLGYGLQGAATGAAVGGVPGAIVGGIAGGVAGLLAGGGEDDVQDMIDAQVDAIWETYREQARQIRKQEGQTVGRARAATGASNLQFRGTPNDYVNALRTEFRQEISWSRRAAQLQSEIVKTGGSMAMAQIERQGLSALIGGIGQIGAYGAGQGWFSRDPGLGTGDWAGTDPFGPGGMYSGVP